MRNIKSGKRRNSSVHLKGLLAPGLLQGTPSVSLTLPGSVACRNTFARLQSPPSSIVSAWSLKLPIAEGHLQTILLYRQLS